MVGVLNASAQSDEEARSRILTTFGPLLLLVFLCDIGCASGMVWIQCSGNRHNNNNDDDGMWQCLQTELVQGAHFQPLPHHRHNSSSNDDDDSIIDGTGDLFLLAVIRCIVTTILLLLGLRYGRYQQNSIIASGANAAAAAAATAEETNRGDGGDEQLTEPLLASSPGDDDEMPEERPNERRGGGCCHRCHRRVIVDPPAARNACLVALFVTSTVYQIYAGLKVSTFPPPDTSPAAASASPSTTPLLAVLMCLTVLWVNAGAYLFRILLSELTREKGLFLPPTVHRHPVFFEASRALALHRCDLCGQRIQNSNSSSSNDNNAIPGCYRCALCDFDLCIPCSQRSDAATVGENVLRGDRGVRVEASMDNASYFRRSLQIAKSELPLLVVSFLLLAASSVSKLLLPHFQGKIIDKVIPDANSSDDGGEKYDKEGFAHYIKLYLFLMLAQVRQKERKKHLNQII